MLLTPGTLFKLIMKCAIGLIVGGGGSGLQLAIVTVLLSLLAVMYVSLSLYSTRARRPLGHVVVTSRQ